MIGKFRFAADDGDRSAGTVGGTQLRLEGTFFEFQFDFDSGAAPSTLT